MRQSAWVAYNKASSTTTGTGIIAGAALTGLVATLKTLRNTGEAFTTTNAVVVGTTVPW